MLTQQQPEQCGPSAPVASNSSGQQQQQVFRELARATDDTSHTTGTKLLHLDGRGLGLTTPSGHACFEVWIAMELCDGGTLAQQVGRGFQYCPNSHQVDLELLLTVALDIARALSYMHSEHVCHGDLKAENVLLKLLRSQAGSEFESTSDCSWLQLLCHSSSNGSMSMHRRRCSNDSCWSFCRSSSGKGGAHTTSSSSDSRSPSPTGREGSSGHNSRHRSSGHLLSFPGLCCTAAADAGASEEDDSKDNPDSRQVLLSGGCLLPRISNPLTAEASHLEQEGDTCVSSVTSCPSDDVASDQPEQAADMATTAAEVEQGTLAAVTALLVAPQPADSGATNQRCKQIPSGDLNSPPQPMMEQLSSSLQHAAEEAAEEEHVAPLSLYTANREHRRSRRLSRNGVLPSVQAALAAAAASGRLDPSLHPSRLLSSASGSSTSGDVNGQSSSDDEKDMLSKNSPDGRLLQSGQHQQAERGTLSLLVALDACDTASDQYPSSSNSGQPLVAASSGGMLSRSSASSGGLTPAQGHCDQRGRGRSRRHSYCYGTTSANYDAMCLSGASNPTITSASLRQQYTCTHAGVSAAEAAAAIAAAAEAAREDMQKAKLMKLAVALAEQKGSVRRHRKRRMSCDDRLLQALSSVPSGEALLQQYDIADVQLPVLGLGRLPLALRKAGSSEAALQGPPAAPGKPRGRMRRHSWTAAYLGDVMDAATAALKGHGLSSFLFADEEQQQDVTAGPAGCTNRISQQLLPRDVYPRSSTNTLAGEGQQLSSAAGPGHNGRMRRARRHSWAGFMTEQQALAAAALGSAGKGARRLSSCFIPSEVVYEGEDADSSHRLPFHLPPCISCCTDSSSYLPLDDADAEAQQSLFSDSNTSSPELLDAVSPLSCEAVNVGCLGRFRARSSGSKSHRKRRSSWCCGSTQDDTAYASGRACVIRSSSSTDLLLPSSFRPSAMPAPVGVAPIHAANKGGRTSGRSRRRSWDGADAHYPLFGVPAAVAGAGTDMRSDDWQTCSINSSTDAAQKQEQAVGVRLPDSLAAAGSAEKATPDAGSLSAVMAMNTPATEAASKLQASSSGAAEGDRLVRDGPYVKGQDLRQSVVIDHSTMHPGALVDPSSPGRLLRQHLHNSSRLAAARQTQQQTAFPATPLAGADAQHKQPSAANSGYQPTLGRDPSLELFTGSFDFKTTDGSRHSSWRNSTLSSISVGLFQEQSIQSPGTSPMAFDSIAESPNSLNPPAASPIQPDDSTAASRTTTAGSNKERRWSTGVAAHDLLLRQQALPKHPSASGSAKVRRASACIPGAFDAIFDGPAAAAAQSVEPFRSQENNPASGSLLSGPQSVNVLGMPRKPTVLGQRRMSYDSATGAYHMVSSPSTATAPAARLPSSNQQLLGLAPTQERASTEAQQEQPAVQPDVDQQQHRDAQQHMQRLIEALGRKGYGGLVFDSVDQPGSSLQQPDALQCLAASTAMASPFAAASASAAETSAKVSGRVRRPSSCVPPAYSRPKYCAKVCDFGFSQCLKTGQSHCSTAAAGTITHQAPEVLKCGYLSPAADIYAFGIIMWELLTGERPFRGLLEGDVVYGVCETGLRPHFPPGAPEAYVTLAQHCWAENTADRPTARQLLKRLNEMLYEVRRQRQLNSCPSPGANSSSSKGTSSSRQRRHSMPAVGAGRKRRASRRLSLFLPFARQPVAVPEHEPLEQPAALVSVGVLSSTISGAAAVATTATGKAAAVPVLAASSPGACCSSGGGGAGTAGGAAALLAGSSSSWGFEGTRVAGARRPAAAAGAPAGSFEQPLSSAEDSSSEWFQSFD